MQTIEWAPVDVAPLDYLKPEGNFEKSETNEWTTGKRVQVVKKPDNLHP